MRTSLLIGSLLLLSCPCLRADDLKTLQGTWTTKIAQNGKEFRVEKEIAENRETVRTFDGNELLRAHVVEFELVSDDNVRIFRWKKGQITAGPDKGKPLADGACLYRFVDDKWIAVFGMLREDKGPVYAQAFERKPDAEKDLSASAK